MRGILYMRLFKKILILIAFTVPLLTACGGDSGGTDVPEEAKYDNATFDKSTWK